MHDDELHVDEQGVRRMVAKQFPDWRHERVRRIAADGTVNAIYRIGSDLTARFPLRYMAPNDMSQHLAEETESMRELASCCPVPTPVTVAVGNPGHGYPLPWSVQTWLHGTVATPNGLAHSEVFAQGLAALIHSLRSADTRGRHFAGSGRGGKLPVSFSEDDCTECPKSSAQRFRVRMGNLERAFGRSTWAASFGVKSFPLEPPHGLEPPFCRTSVSG